MKKELEIQFKQNRIDPALDTAEKVPDLPGNYIICLRKQSILPKTSIKPILTKFQGLDVVYVGRAKDSLMKRDFKQHFKGNNAGRSTLRLSLGSLLEYEKIPRDENPDSTKTKFTLTKEKMLTEWMSKNLILFVYPTQDCIKTEMLLIKEFNPPLNLEHLKGQTDNINNDFRKLLTSLRRPSTEVMKKDVVKKVKNKSTNLKTDIVVENASFGHLLLAIGGLSAVGLCILAIIFILGLMIYSMFL